MYICARASPKYGFVVQDKETLIDYTRRGRKGGRVTEERGAQLASRRTRAVRDLRVWVLSCVCARCDTPNRNHACYATCVVSFGCNEGSVLR